MSPAKLIYERTGEQYVKYCLEHFSRKYGLEITEDSQKADIYIGYVIPEMCNAIVQVILRPTPSDKICYLTTEKDTVPLFQKPTEQTKGNSIWKVVYEDQEYTCLSIIGNRIIIGFDIFSQIGRILAGCYDNYFLRKDKLGLQLRTIPIVDVLEESIFSLISSFLSSQYLTQYSIWPDGHKFALVLTHDVDRVYKTYQYLPSLWNSVASADLPELGHQLYSMLIKHGKKNPYWTFEEICNLENNLEVKSTYYFLNETGKLNIFSLESWMLYRGLYDIKSKEIMNIIKKLDKAGFEIGVHGSYNAYINQNLLLTEKNTMESIISTKIKGVRQHYLNYNNDITAVIQNRCGFQYDTSIGFKPDIGAGFKRGTSFPFRIMLPNLNISPLMEIPLIIMDQAIARDATVTLDECFKLIDQVEKYRGVLTILWHTNMFGENNLEMVKLYTKLIREAKNRGAWITKACDICELLR